MREIFVLLTAVAGLLGGRASAQSCALEWAQCGGATWTGPFCCQCGLTCVPQTGNPYYSQCLKDPPPVTNCAPEWAQCGGMNWNGQTCCQNGLDCVPQAGNPYYSQCLRSSNLCPSSGTASVGSTLTTSASSKSSLMPSSTSSTTSSSAARASTSTTQSTSSKKSSASTTISSSSTTSSSTASPSGKVKYAGVNIAGFDFGCDICGSCGTNYPPVPPSGPDGPGQMLHFVRDDGLNAFRLPVSWQYLINSDLNSNTLNANNVAMYHQLVQGCLNTGASLCIIDMHNYARYNDAIIGQGGPTIQQFASIWGQLATKYSGETRVAFGLMNEPHDGACNSNVVDINTWKSTLQATVNAIRAAGATLQLILLPGKGWTHAATYLNSDGSGPALLSITNPDKSTNGLIFEVHEYLDQNDSGCDGCNCVTNNIDTSYGRGGLSNLATWLRQNHRQAFLSETGGPQTTECGNLVCQELSFLNSNSDVFLGWTGWGAGSFDQYYSLTETPIKNPDGSWTDQQLVSQCVAKCFNGKC